MRSSVRFFKPPVLLYKPAIDELCVSAVNGYEVPYKEEAFGFLFGRLSSEERLVVLRSVAYGGGTRTRTGVDFTPGQWAHAIRRRRELAATLRLSFAGCFHSHVGERYKRSWGLSPDDRDRILDDEDVAIELLVSVCEGRKGVLSPLSKSISWAIPNTPYQGIIRVYAKHYRSVVPVPSEFVTHPAVF